MVGTNLSKQFLTQQNDKQILQIIGEEGTSGFFSGNELANLRGAFMDEHSRVYTSQMQSKHSKKPSLPQSYYNQQSQDSIPVAQNFSGLINNTNTNSTKSLKLLSHAVQPNQVFDLPSALQEI